MPGLGTIVNIALVVAGGLFGGHLGHRIPKRIHTILTRFVGLFAVYVGMEMFLKKEHFWIVFCSLTVGWTIGHLLKLGHFFTTLADRIGHVLRIDESTFLEGFITASLVYCIGPMAMLGPITEGLSGDHRMLYTKAVIDGITAIGLATSLGIGVVFSVLPIAVYQGGMTVIAVFAGELFPHSIVRDLTSVGGLLIGGIGMNILGIFKRKIPVENMLPAIVIAVLLAWLFTVPGTANKWF